jgi:putative transposase
MPRARKTLISTDDTPYYHCVSRCVRRAFLCGKDTLTGNSYEHRRQWVQDRLLLLADVFAIDICAFAVMSNHTHVVLHINQEKATSWSVSEVINRWHRLHKGTLLSHQYIDASQRENINDAVIETVTDTAEIWRKRLCDISWFMRSLNEYIARLANKEDNCTGRFWEGRFKSQALLDEAALAACMAYVDLNPIRANMASTPEASDHTSVQFRIKAARNGKKPTSLMPFVGSPCKDMPSGLPFTLCDYLALVDVTGRELSHHKKGLIRDKERPLLERLNLSPEQWAELTQHFEARFHHAAGSESYLARYQQHHQLRCVKGINSARRLLSSG